MLRLHFAVVAVEARWPSRQEHGIVPDGFPLISKTCRKRSCKFDVVHPMPLGFCGRCVVHKVLCMHATRCAARRHWIQHQRGPSQHLFSAVRPYVRTTDTARSSLQCCVSKYRSSFRLLPFGLDLFLWTPVRLPSGTCGDLTLHGVVTGSESPGLSPDLPTIHTRLPPWERVVSLSAGHPSSAASTLARAVSPYGSVARLIFGVRPLAGGGRGLARARGDRSLKLCQAGRAPICLLGLRRPPRA